MTITRVKTTYVVAEDVEASVAFYTDILGVPIRFRDGSKWVQFSTEGADFAVASRGEAGVSTQSTVMVFAASEEADHVRMIGAGAELVGTREMGDHGRSRTYRDPGGNILQLLWKG